MNDPGLALPVGDENLLGRIAETVVLTFLPPLGADLVRLQWRHKGVARLLADDCDVRDAHPRASVWLPTTGSTTSAMAWDRGSGSARLGTKGGEIWRAPSASPRDRTPVCRSRAGARAGSPSSATAASTPVPART